MKSKSHLEETLKIHLRASKIASRYEWINDKYDKDIFDGRKFRFDFRCNELKLAIECDGGLYMGKGCHNNGKQIERDIEKYDIAMRNGWDIYRCGKKLIYSGQAIETIEILIKAKEVMAE